MGHDNFEIRKGREEERKSEVAVNLAQYRDTTDMATREQLRVVQLSLGQSATADEIEAGRKAAGKLSNKLAFKYLGQNVVRGELRRMVMQTLQLHQHQ